MSGPTDAGVAVASVGGSYPVTTFHLLNPPPPLHASPGVLLHIKYVMESVCDTMSFTDVSIITASDTLRAHRSVLSAHSIFLSELLSDHNQKEEDIHVLHFPNYPSVYLRMLLQFFYTGEVSEMRLSDIEPLRDLSYTLGISSLVARLDDVKLTISFQNLPSYESQISSVHPQLHHHPSSALHPASLQYQLDRSRSSTSLQIVGNSCTSLAAAAKHCAPNLTGTTSQQQQQQMQNNVDDYVDRISPSGASDADDNSNERVNAVIEAASAAVADIFGGFTGAPSSDSAADLVVSAITSSAGSRSHCGPSLMGLTNGNASQSSTGREEKLQLDDDSKSTELGSITVTSSTSMDVHHLSVRPNVLNTVVVSDRRVGLRLGDSGGDARTLIPSRNDGDVYQSHHPLLQQSGSLAAQPPRESCKFLEQREKNKVKTRKATDKFSSIPVRQYTVVSKMPKDTNLQVSKKCPYCQLKFFKMDTYQSHLRLHQGEQHVTCPICQKRISSKYHLNTHIQTIHSKVKFPCSYIGCNKEFSDPSALRRHTRNHHSPEDAVKHRCPKCGREFVDQSTWKRHVDAHSPRIVYTCSVCGKGFKRVSQLKRHKRLVHPGQAVEGEDRQAAVARAARGSGSVNGFLAGSSLLESSGKLQLTGVNAISSESRVSTCGVCNAVFRKPYDLKVHMMVHTGEKPFQCTMCPKSFSRSYNFQLHVRTHTGEKPHACARCGRCFSDVAAFRRHCRTHSGERPYTCTLCNAKFTQGSTLKNHLTNCKRRQRSGSVGTSKDQSI